MLIDLGQLPSRFIPPPVSASRCHWDIEYSIITLTAGQIHPFQIRKLIIKKFVLPGDVSVLVERISPKAVSLASCLDVAAKFVKV